MTAPLRYRARARLTVRSTWIIAAAVLLAVSAAVSAWTAVRVEQGVRRDREQVCDQRHESREEIRQAIVAAVDEVAVYAEVQPPGRGQVVAQVEARVAAELPPPDC